MKTKTCPKTRQLTLVWGPPILEGLAKKERARAVSLLAQLLLEASGVVEEEEDNEDQ